MLNPAQRKSFERALSTANGLEDKIQYLLQVGAVAPKFTQSIEALDTRRKYIKQLASVLLTADNSSRPLE